MWIVKQKKKQKTMLIVTEQNRSSRDLAEIIPSHQTPYPGK